MAESSYVLWEKGISQYPVITLSYIGMILRRGTEMEDLQIISLYFKRDEAAISETATKYGAFCHRIALNNDA